MGIENSERATTTTSSSNWKFFFAVGTEESSCRLEFPFQLHTCWRLNSLQIDALTLSTYVWICVSTSVTNIGSKSFGDHLNRVIDRDFTDLIDAYKYLNRKWKDSRLYLWVGLYQWYSCQGKIASYGDKNRWQEFYESKDLPSGTRSKLNSSTCGPFWFLPSASSNNFACRERHDVFLLLYYGP